MNNQSWGYEANQRALEVGDFEQAELLEAELGDAAAANGFIAPHLVPGLVAPPTAPPVQPWWQRLVEQVVPAALTVWQMAELRRINRDRMAAGVPPLTAEQYAAIYMPPAARIEVAPPAIPDWAVLGGLGVAGVVLWALLRR